MFWALHSAIALLCYRVEIILATLQKRIRELNMKSMRRNQTICDLDEDSIFDEWLRHDRNDVQNFPSSVKCRRNIAVSLSSHQSNDLLSVIYWIRIFSTARVRVCTHISWTWHRHLMFGGVGLEARMHGNFLESEDVYREYFAHAQSNTRQDMPHPPSTFW